MAKASTHFAAGISAFAAVSCATPSGSRCSRPNGEVLAKEIERFVRDNRTGADQNTLVIGGDTPAEVGHHFVRTRKAEPLRIHPNYDLTAFASRRSSIDAPRSGTIRSKRWWI